MYMFNAGDRKDLRLPDCLLDAKGFIKAELPYSEPAVKLCYLRSKNSLILSLF